jgi:hypothetical protein
VMSPILICFMVVSPGLVGNKRNGRFPAVQAAGGARHARFAQHSHDGMAIAIRSKP